MSHEGRLAELTEWLTTAARSAGLVIDGQCQPEIVETWSSRTATLHRFTLANSAVSDVVVKVHRNPGEALTHFRSLTEVGRELAGDPNSRIAAIRPLGVSSELGAVLMPHVAGTCLSDLLVDGRWSSEAVQTDLRGIVHLCGILLARYHGRPENVTKDMRQAAHDRLASRFERLLNRKVYPDNLTADGPIVKSYQDFHPGHIIVTETGRVAAIDPPIEVRHDYYYRDLALFSHSLHMGLIDPRGLRTNPRRIRHRASLVTAFLDGYTATTGRPLTADDRFFIEGWEAFYLTRMLRKAHRSRSYGRLAYYYLLTRRRLRHLKLEVERRLLAESS